MPVACTCGRIYPSACDLAVHHQSMKHDPERHRLACTNCGIEIGRIAPGSFKGLLVEIRGRGFIGTYCEACRDLFVDYGRDLIGLTQSMRCRIIQ